MEKHTPGKWIYQDHRELETNYGDWHYGLTIRDKQNICLAVVGHIEAAVKEEAEANARLFAAAPELLEACQMVLELLEKNMEIWYLQQHYKQLTQAIEKATEV